MDLKQSSFVQLIYNLIIFARNILKLTLDCWFQVFTGKTVLQFICSPSISLINIYGNIIIQREYCKSYHQKSYFIILLTLLVKYKVLIRWGGERNLYKLCNSKTVISISTLTAKIYRNRNRNRNKFPISMRIFMDIVQKFYSINNKPFFI